MPLVFAKVSLYGLVRSFTWKKGLGVMLKFRVCRGPRKRWGGSGGAL